MDAKYDKKLLLSHRYARLRRINKIKNNFKYLRALKAYQQSEKKKKAKCEIWSVVGYYSIKKYNS